MLDTARLTVRREPSYASAMVLDNQPFHAITPQINDDTRSKMTEWSAKGRKSHPKNVRNTKKKEWRRFYPV